jgi:hypothetical protein
VWHTYLPDGRSLILRRLEGLWVATCGPKRAEAADPAEAIRGAVAGPDGVDEPLEAWIAEHAAELDPESS